MLLLGLVGGKFIEPIFEVLQLQLGSKTACYDMVHELQSLSEIQFWQNVIAFFLSFLKVWVFLLDHVPKQGLRGDAMPHIFLILDYSGDGNTFDWTISRLFGQLVWKLINTDIRFVALTCWVEFLEYDFR